MAIKVRRDSAADWASNNPTPEAGQPCFETDTQLMKVGDGATAYNSLPYEGVEVIVVAISDETSDLSVGDGKLTFRMPFTMRLFSGNAGVRASAVTAPTGATIILDVEETGATIFSTKLSIDADEKTSLTAASAVVLSDVSLAADAEIKINVDQVGSTVPGAGVKVTFIGNRMS